MSLASLGLSVEAMNVAKAVTDLKSLSQSATGAERAAKALSGGAAMAGTSLNDMARLAAGAAHMTRTLTQQINLADAANKVFAQSMTMGMSAVGSAALVANQANERLVRGMGAASIAAKAMTRDLVQGMSEIGRQQLILNQANERLIKGMSAATPKFVQKELVEGMAEAGRYALILNQANERLVLGMGAVSLAAKAMRTDLVQGMSDAGRSALVLNQANERLVTGLGAAGRLAAEQQRAMADAMRITADQVRASNAGIAAYGDRLAQLREKYAPVAMAQQRQTQLIREINEAQRMGAITDTERVAAIRTVEASTAAQIKALKLNEQQILKTGKAALVSGYQMQNLAFQINDVATMAAMGMDPLRIFTSQAGQIYQVLAMTEGGAKAALGEIGSRIVSWITPLRLATLGFVGLGAAAASALHAAVRDSIELNVALSGVGRASGQTAASINALAIAAAEAGATTAGQARDIAIAFAETGKIGPEITEQYVEMSRRFAVTFGEDMPDAAKRMAKALEDPARGVDDLNKRLGSFDDAARRQIMFLSNTNQRLEAQRLLMDGVNRGLVSHIDSTSRLGRAWRQAMSDMSYYWEKLKQNIPGATSEDPVDAAVRDAEKRLEKLGRERNIMPWFWQPPFEEWEKAAEKYRAANEAKRNKSFAEEKAKLDAIYNTRAVSAADMARSLVPDFDQLQRAAEELSVLGDALGNSEIFDRLDDSSRLAVERALSIRKAQSVWLNEAIKNGGVAISQAEEEHRLAMMSITARSTAQRAELAFQEEITRLRRAGDPDAEARAEMKRAEIYQQVAEQVRRQQEQRMLSADHSIEADQRELHLVGQTVATRDRELALLQVRHQLEEEALRLEGDRNAYDHKALKALEDKVRSQEELNQKIAYETTLRELAFERDQMGRSAREQRVYEQLNSLGLLTNGQIVGPIAEARAELIRFNEVMRISQDASKEFATGFVKDVMAGTSAVESLANAMNRLADKLLDMAMDQAFSALFAPFSQSVASGATSQASGGLFGGLILPGILHNGGIAGNDNVPTRAVHASVFNGAPRYHSGGIAGLKPNEVPAILERGERVIPKGQSANSGGAGPISVTYQIDASGADPKTVARLEVALAESNRDLESRVIKIVRDGRQRGYA